MGAGLSDVVCKGLYDVVCVATEKLLRSLVVCVMLSFRLCVMGCVCVLECSTLHFLSRIMLNFLYSMCIGKTRPHAKFQVSSLNILSRPPFFGIEIQEGGRQKKLVKTPLIIHQNFCLN